MNAKLTIVIGGDTVPTRSNENYLINGREELVFNGVKEVFSHADLAIVNLECPLTNQEMEIRKTGPHFKAKPESICGLINAGIKIFSLANNHIFDYGPGGLYDTLKCIAEQQAYFVGAGKNLNDARKTCFVEKNGYKIAFISAAEHEFASAKENAPGANRFDPFDTIEDIKMARMAADCIVVLYHAGVEQYRLPSPGLQRVCHKMVEAGANFVFCQHSHCIGAYEKYEDGDIVYGQGNLLFDYLDMEEWQTSLLIKITVDGRKREMELLPVVKKGFSIDLADGAEKEKILSSLYQRSEKIMDRQYIEKEWIELSNKRRYRYLQAVLGISGWLKRVDNKFGHLITKSLVNTEVSTRLYNYLTCDSNLEILRSILENQTEKS